MTHAFARLRRDEEGATAIEYTLILSIISMAAVIAFAALGLNFTDIITLVADTLAGANP